MEELKFVIPIPPRTKKNSSRIIINPRTKKPLLLPSKLYEDYETDCAKYIPHLYINKPYFNNKVNVKCIYYMKTKRRVDLTNLMEATHDMLVNYGVISDDNSNIIVSVDGSRVLYDKEHPRTEIVITAV